MEAPGSASTTKQGEQLASPLLAGQVCSPSKHAARSWMPTQGIFSHIFAFSGGPLFCQFPLWGSPPWWGVCKYNYYYHYLLLNTNSIATCYLSLKLSLLTAYYCYCQKYVLLTTDTIATYCSSAPLFLLTIHCWYYHYLLFISTTPTNSKPI